MVMFYVCKIEGDLLILSQWQAGLLLVESSHIDAFLIQVYHRSAGPLNHIT